MKLTTYSLVLVSKRGGSLYQCPCWHSQHMLGNSGKLTCLPSLHKTYRPM